MMYDTRYVCTVYGSVSSVTLFIFVVSSRSTAEMAPRMSASDRNCIVYVEIFGEDVRRQAERCESLATVTDKR